MERLLSWGCFAVAAVGGYVIPADVPSKSFYNSYRRYRNRFGTSHNLEGGIHRDASMPEIAS